MQHPGESHESYMSDMITVYNDTAADAYYFSINFQYLDEIIILSIMLGIWVFSIMQFIR